MGTRRPKTRDDSGSSVRSTEPEHGSGAVLGSAGVTVQVEGHESGQLVRKY